jgi:hypothetical protein
VAGSRATLEEPAWVSRPDPARSDRTEGAVRHDSRSLPGGLSCLIKLDELGIARRSPGELRGVLTPVVVTGPVGSVIYRPMGRRPLLADCRLILALQRATPVLAELGVSEVHYSSAYAYRLMRGGRPSRHAMGLAIDVHRVRVRGELLRVKQHYVRGLQDGCAPGAPVLNQLACVLERGGYFDRVLTPDTNRAHRNHFHLAILSLHRRRHVPRDTPPPPIRD